MDIDEEFDSLSLPSEKESLAWKARAKITWGEPIDEIETWLTVNGIDPFTAEQIVAIAVRERALANRVKGFGISSWEYLSVSAEQGSGSELS